MLVGWLVVLSDVEHTDDDTFEHSRIDWHSAASSLLLSRDSNVFVLAAHGKSQHTAVWSLDALRHSNAQLRELGPQRTNDSVEYKLPDEGFEKALSGLMVHVQKR